jgi:sugar/nucleoside kinase (ribokinase family)
VAPVAPAVVRSTLGAGDAFGAATVAWLAQGQPLEAALRAGAHAAAGVLGAADAHSAAPSLAALRAALKADSVEDRTTARDLTDGDLPAAA